MLATHLSYFAVVGQEVSTKLAMRIMTVRRLWLRNRSFVAVRMELTAPARVTGVFVAPDGSTVPGQTIKTPTRHAGVTILRVPLRITQPGLYKLQMHAEGAGQVVDRTAKINFMAARPGTPVWQDGALRVAIVRGASGLSSLTGLLGKHFVVRRTADAGLYDVLDTSNRTAAAVVVVDLGTVPTYTLAELHALLPEVQIVGLTSTPAKAAYYRRIGVNALLPRTASAAQVARAVKSARALAARAPKRLVPAREHVRGAREDEEQVGDAVQIDPRQRVDVRFERGDLCAPRGSPRDMQPGRRFRPARQDEALQLGKRGVVLVAESLEVVDHLLGRAQALVGTGERHREVGADVEQLVLHARKRHAKLRRQVARERDADVRVQLVDDAVRADPRVELRRARAVAEARLPFVAAARVDAGQADGLVFLARHASRVRG